MNFLENINILFIILQNVFSLLFFVIIIIKITRSFRRFARIRKSDYVNLNSERNVLDSNNHFNLLLCSYAFSILKNLTDADFTIDNFYSILFNSVLIAAIYFLNRVFKKKEDELREGMISNFNIEMDSITNEK